MVLICMITASGLEFDGQISADSSSLSANYTDPYEIRSNFTKKCNWPHDKVLTRIDAVYDPVNYKQIETMEPKIRD
jgi:hypothetical protein